MPVGLLIYAGDGIDTKQYVVERYDCSELLPTSNIYRRDDYNFKERISDHLLDEKAERERKRDPTAAD